MFLPEQIDVLARHLNLTRKELFAGYLIAEMCAPTDCYTLPTDCVTPVFVLSPVKAQGGGKRLTQRLFDIPYIQITDHHCIFRDRQNNRCSIHEIKPFECAVMLCCRMTKDKPMYLGKSYYYHKWKDAQEIPLSLFPELRPLYKKLETSLRWLKKSFEEKNQIIQEIITSVNVQSHREGKDAELP
jgi:hypothetical protein